MKHKKETKPPIDVIGSGIMCVICSYVSVVSYIGYYRDEGITSLRMGMYTSPQARLPIANSAALWAVIWGLLLVWGIVAQKRKKFKAKS